MPQGYKSILITALSILLISLLPGVATGWAEAEPNPARVNSNAPPLRPPAQGEWPQARPTSSADDTIVRFGEGPAELSSQSDGSGIAVVPGAAFVHTGELGTGSEANDWFFDFALGFLTSDSATNPVCLAAPVYLPAGSVIDSFTVYAFDDYAPSNLVVYLDRTNVYDPFNPWDELGRVQASNSNAIQTLTDPSICSDPTVCAAGANIVSILFNYHVDFCLPAGSGGFMGIFGAQVNYSIPPQSVYLPVTLKAPPDTGPPLTTLYIKNDTGGVITYYRVLSIPDNKLVTECNNVPAGITALCGNPFPAGDYKWQGDAPNCNPSTGGQEKKNYGSGDFTHTLFCSTR